MGKFSFVGKRGSIKNCKADLWSVWRALQGSRVSEVTKRGTLINKEQLTYWKMHGSFFSHVAFIIELNPHKESVVALVNASVHRQ